MSDVQYFRCDVCHGLSDKVNWSDTSVREATYALNGDMVELVDYNGPRRLIPYCINCGGRARAVHHMTNAMINMVVPTSEETP